MSKLRYAQISLEATPYYHGYSRCVRRGLLCGLDTIIGINYEHRKRWLEDRIYTAPTAFAPGLCTYAILLSHYHAVVYANKLQADTWHH